MCVVNKQFELLQFVFIPFMLTCSMMRFLSLTAKSVSLCCVYGLVVVFGLSVMRVLLFVLHVCLLRECDGARLTAMLVWGMDKVW